MIKKRTNDEVIVKVNLVHFYINIFGHLAEDFI